MAKRSILNEIEVKQLAIIKRLSQDLAQMVDMFTPPVIEEFNQPEEIDAVVHRIRVANESLQKLKLSCVLR